MPVKIRITAEYLYPGLLFPEELHKDLDTATLTDAVRHQKDDGWYAVHIKSQTMSEFVDDEGEKRWLPKDDAVKSSYVIGKVYNEQQIRAWGVAKGQDTSILEANCGSWGGQLVLCRTGNWQPRKGYDFVVAEGSPELQVKEAAAK